jgi:dsDNA-binding SOS-regulon protein
MAVIVKYIVVRNGEEKMTFATKKEADAYDKMLDIADNLFEFLEKSKIKLNETQLEEISLLLAENRMELVPVLRGMKPLKKTAAKSVAKKSLPKKTKIKK